MIKQNPDPIAELRSLIIEKGLSVESASRFFNFSHRQLRRLVIGQVSAPYFQNRVELLRGLKRLRALPNFPRCLKRKIEIPQEPEA
jgi:hypothetical protein